MLDLFGVFVLFGCSGGMCVLEVMVVVYGDVVLWCYLV